MASGAVAACGPQVVTPTPPTGRVVDGGALAAVPRPGLATDLGTFGPGFDGSGDFLSFASELSPASTMAAYADQLAAAGFHDVGRQGAWRVFSDPNVTLLVRVGAGGPPTSLIVRVAPTAEDVDLVDVADGPATLPAVGITQSVVDSVAFPADRILSAGPPDPKGVSEPTVVARRPDPPHAGPRSGAVGATGSGTAGSATTASGTPATSGTGSATAASGSTTGSGTMKPGAIAVPAGAASSPSPGPGSKVGGGTSQP